MPDGGKDFRLNPLGGSPLKDLTRGSQALENLNRNKKLGATSDLKEINKASQDFEALLLQQMFKSMWNTIPSTESMLGSKEEEHYRDFLNEELAKEISEGQGIGIKEVIRKDILKLQKE